MNAAQLALLFEELRRQGDTAAAVDATAEDRDNAEVNEEIQAAEDARKEAVKEIASKPTQEPAEPARRRAPGAQGRAQ